MIHNFNAGPSILPREVYEEAAKAILDYNGTGLSILEIGHRTKLIESMLAETVQLAKELMKLDADHEVLFLHGGATTQFFQVPMNLLGENQTAAYLDCGVWGSKAIKEAKLFGNVKVVASSKDKNYSYIPKDYVIPTDAVYFHYTTNNTIEGTEMFDIPDTSVPLIADMSSDILSHAIDFNRFALIYAGAQKNIGATGVNMVVVRKDILGKINRPLPGMMDYRQHIEAESMLNTPPVFAIFVCLLTLRWLKKQGGVAAIEKINIAKADLLYKTLETTTGFELPVATEDRSRMNVVFLIPDSDLEKRFLEACTKENIIGVKGHRSVGGYRASLYNALPLESVQVLSELIKQL